MTTPQTFRALRITEEDKNYVTKIENMPYQKLNEENWVSIKVAYSSLNYKDALSCAGNKGVTRNYPHTPGIDAAGVVTESTSANLSVGAEVLVTGFQLGMNHPGGLAEYIQVPAEWVVNLPKGLSMRAAMELGTAGFTAALSVHRLLQNGQKPEMGKVLVTGAKGGVGSVGCQLLSKLGFQVIAAGTEALNSQELEALKAIESADASQTNDESGRPMLKPTWAGALDVVGGNTLATILKACAPMGSVTTCGNIGSGDLLTTVYPFILRGVSLLGVDSQNCPHDLRQEVWNLLSSDWKLDLDQSMITEIRLDQVMEYIEIMQAKKSRGRIVVKVG